VCVCGCVWMGVCMRVCVCLCVWGWVCVCVCVHVCAGYYYSQTETTTLLIKNAPPNITEEVESMCVLLDVYSMCALLPCLFYTCIPGCGCWCVCGCDCGCEGGVCVWV